jgi:hypothetical protein
MMMNIEMTKKEDLRYHRLKPRIEFTCWYEITNDNWETIESGKLRVHEWDTNNAEAHFHDLMTDKMSSVEDADDYFLTEMEVGSTVKIGKSYLSLEQFEKEVA